MRQNWRKSKNKNALELEKGKSLKIEMRQNWGKSKNKNALELEKI